jgi:hypothetical protein
MVHPAEASALKFRSKREFVATDGKALVPVELDPVGVCAGALT